MRYIYRLPSGPGKLCTCPERTAFVPGPMSEVRTSSPSPRNAFLVLQEAS